MKLDHPCKQTCSGWQQGYEAGVASAGADKEMIIAITDGPIVAENITIDQRYRFEQEIAQLKDELALAQSDLSVKHKYRADVLERQCERLKAEVGLAKQLCNQRADRVDQLKADLTKAVAALERVGGMAGDPDPLRGCQNIAKFIGTTLAELKRDG